RPSVSIAARTLHVAQGRTDRGFRVARLQRAQNCPNSGERPKGSCARSGGTHACKVKTARQINAPVGPCAKGEDRGPENCTMQAPRDARCLHGSIRRSNPAYRSNALNIGDAAQMGTGTRETYDSWRRWP